MKPIKTYSAKEATAIIADNDFSIEVDKGDGAYNAIKNGDIFTYRVSLAKLIRRLLRGIHLTKTVGFDTDIIVTTDDDGNYHVYEYEV